MTNPAESQGITPSISIGVDTVEAAVAAIALVQLVEILGNSKSIAAIVAPTKAKPSLWCAVGAGNKPEEIQSMPATKAEIVAFMATQFPQSKCVVEAIGDCSAIVSHHIGPDELRPGGTVSGPVLMSVADVALYVAILAKIGIVPLTVTTSLTINFLRKPSAQARIVGECKLMKVGRSLVTGEVSLYSGDRSEPVVAHAVGTYSIPPKR